MEHVNAHATTTPEGDRAELEMLRALFGDRAGEVSVTANKAMLGHTLGAAGAIEAVVAIRTLRDGRRAADDQPRRSRRGGGRAGPDARTSPAQRPIRVAVSNSFGFGGQNSALVLRRWDG